MMLNTVIWIIYIAILYITVFQIIVLLEKDSLTPGVEWLDEWPSLTITIPAYNEEDTIEMTVESVLSADYPEDKLDVIVVDDGSKDATAERVKKFEQQGVTLIQQENQGKGAALNTGLENAEGDFFACVDADSRLKDDSLKNIVSEFDENTGAIASAMKVHNPQNRLQKIQWLEYLVGIFTRSIMGRINAIHVTPGPLSVYRTNVLCDIGGFDEESLVEDQEICFRMQRHHWDVKHSRKGEVYTVAPSRLGELYNQRKRWYRGSLENIIKYRDMVFNTDYGEFGTFALPSKLIMGSLSVLTVFLISYLTFSPLANVFSNFLQIGWDVFNFSGSISWSLVLNEIWWRIISIRTTTNMLLLTMLSLSIILAYMAGKHTDEDVLGEGFLPAAVYLFIFVFFIGFMWLVVSIRIIADMVKSR